MASYDEKLCFMTATEAVSQFKAKKLSPVELVDALIARCEDINPKINALTTMFFDRARHQAKEAEARYTKSDGRLRPLEGVPVAIKDFHPVKGEITTFGSKIFENFRPDYTAPTVQRLFDAGAIMHCRTTTPEFAYSGVTHSPLWGISRNPWNLRLYAGWIVGRRRRCGRRRLDHHCRRHRWRRLNPHPVLRLWGRRLQAAIRQKSARSRSSTRAFVALWADYAQRRRCGAHAERHVGSASRRPLLAARALGHPRTARRHPRLEDRVLDEPRLFRGRSTGPAQHARRARSLQGLGCTIHEVNLNWNWGTLDAWMTQWEGLFAGLCEQYLPRWRFQMDPVVVKILERGQNHSAARFLSLQYGARRNVQDARPYP